MKSIDKNSPFIIAEMSGNHNKSLSRALAIVDAAAEAGVSALKLQTLTPDTITINSKRKEFKIDDKRSLWYGKRLYELYNAAFLPWEWHKEIFTRCKKKGIVGFSTPFDDSAVDYLESLNVPIYKIASFEIIDIPLIRKVASTGKPIIMSTGMATVKEIGEAVCAARDSGCKELVLLKCTSSYPATHENSNILTIPDIRTRFGCQAGLSDHTMGIGAAVAATALGATVIEKHFTLSRAAGGVDSAFSMEPKEMKLLVEEVRNAALAMGKVFYGTTEAEKNSLIFRRSLYVVKDMKKGDIFTRDNMRSIRPGLGLPPKHYNEFIGKRINKNIKRGTPLAWGMLDKNG